MPLVDLFIHLTLITAAPPLLLGLIVKTKALFAGRVGAPLLQPYFELRKLVGKGLVLSTSTTFLFWFGPLLGVVTTFVAGLLIPLGCSRAPIAFVGDLVLFVYLFGLARFFALLASLDTASSFEGMGAAREATFACLTEPTLVLGLLVLARQSSSLSLSTMLGGALAGRWLATPAVLVLVVVSLFIVVLAEASRIPIDDPNTHLELTMIHEAMVLDHSGPLLALVQYGAALKLFVLGAIVVRAALPVGTGALWGNWALFAAGMGAFAVTIGVVESVMARVRLNHVPSLLIAACLMSGFGIVLLAR